METREIGGRSINVKSRLVIIFGASCLLVGCTALLPPAADGPASGDLPIVRIGEHEFWVEIADTNAARIRGLMGRTALADDAGRRE